MSRYDDEVQVRVEKLMLMSVPEAQMATALGLKGKAARQELRQRMAQVREDWKEQATAGRARLLEELGKQLAQSQQRYFQQNLDYLEGQDRPAVMRLMQNEAKLAVSLLLRWMGKSLEEETEAREVSDPQTEKTLDAILQDAAMAPDDSEDSTLPDLDEDPELRRVDFAKLTAATLFGGAATSRPQVPGDPS